MKQVLFFKKTVDVEFTACASSEFMWGGLVFILKTPLDGAKVKRFPIDTLGLVNRFGSSKPELLTSRGILLFSCVCFMDYFGTNLYFQHEHSWKPPTGKIKHIEIQEHLKGEVRNQLVDHCKTNNSAQNIKLKNWSEIWPNEEKPLIADVTTDLKRSNLSFRLENIFVIDLKKLKRFFRSFFLSF